MLVLYDAATDCVLVARPGLRVRLGARLAAGRLDRELANGASPDSTVPLSLRARILIRPAERHALSRSLERILEASPQLAGRGPRTLTPRFYRRVGAASGEIRELIARLRSPGPVSAEGMAKIRVLLSDSAGPLHQANGDLVSAIHDALRALEPEPSWG
jgi:hypothetical protein